MSEQQYRMLHVGETVFDDDEIRCIDGSWSKTAQQGMILEDRHAPYRRPITLDDKQYETLGHGDILQEGDEHLFQDTWGPTLRVGDLVDDGAYRRPITAKDKPPIGIMPINVWLENRCRDLIVAMERRETLDSELGFLAEELFAHLEIMGHIRNRLPIRAAQSSAPDDATNQQR